MEWDRRVTYVAEETEKVIVVATEYYKEDELVRRDVDVTIKQGFEQKGEVKNG